MSHKILIIEDDAIVARSIVNTLKANQFEIAGIAGNCQKAYELISSTFPDLVICNLYLKFECADKNLFDKFRAFSKMPFVFLSSYSHDRRLDAILQTKYEIYLSTPFTHDELIESVNSLLGVRADFHPAE